MEIFHSNLLDLSSIQCRSSMIWKVLYTDLFHVEWMLACLLASEMCLSYTMIDAHRRSNCTSLSICNYICTHQITVGLPSQRFANLSPYLVRRDSVQLVFFLNCFYSWLHGTLSTLIHQTSTDASVVNNYAAISRLSNRCPFDSPGYSLCPCSCSTLVRFSCYVCSYDLWFL